VYGNVSAHGLLVLKTAFTLVGSADEKTIKNHLNLLDKNQQKIYKIFTKSIQNGN